MKILVREALLRMWFCPLKIWTKYEWNW